MWHRLVRMASIGALRRPQAVVTGILVFVLAAATLFRTSWPFDLLTPQTPIRVMVVGDSISHGWEGDYTWRYRLWQWFRKQRVAVEFVGPYTGTKRPDDDLNLRTHHDLGSSPVSQLDVDENAPAVERNYGLDDGGYAAGVSGKFDVGRNGHFAVWGRTIFKTKDEIREMVLEYEPDYLLVELGFNDLGWFFGPDDTLLSMKMLVDNARAARPDLKFAIANAPHRSGMEGAEDIPVKTDRYNLLLAKAIAMWTSEESPIELLGFRENYSCETSSCPAGYDGLHPNALGEYQIAQAFTKVLHHKYGLGRSDLSIPKSIPLRPCATPRHVQATPAPNATKVTWDAAYGAYGYEFQTRVVETDWPDFTFFTLTSHYEIPWTGDGRRWEVRIRSNCGKNIQSAWFDVVATSL